MLPPYESLQRIGQVVGAAAGTVREFSRGLARVERRVGFGPHPFSFILVAFGLIRRRGVVLGVRQDTRAYYRNACRTRAGVPLSWRLPASTSGTAPCHASSRRRRSATSSRATTAGGAGKLPISVASDADVVDRPLDRNWKRT